MEVTISYLKHLQNTVLLRRVYLREAYQQRSEKPFSEGVRLKPSFFSEKFDLRELYHPDFELENPEFEVYSIRGSDGLQETTFENLQVGDPFFHTPIQSSIYYHFAHSTKWYVKFNSKSAVRLSYLNVDKLIDFYPGSRALIELSRNNISSSNWDE